MTNDSLIKNYRDRFRQHGPGPQAVQYADHESHYARFKILSEIVPDMESVLDVGCGLADFCHFMRAQGKTTRYTGVDIVEEFIDHARSTLITDPAAEVICLDVETQNLPCGHDWVLLSGVFNNKMDDNRSFMETTLRRMWIAAERGIAFNAMSTWVDYHDSTLWYVDPLEVFAFCKTELGGHPVLRHDYVTRPGGFPFEFAMYVYKKPR